MPTSRFALTWDKFAEKYGALTFLTVAGQPFLVLNSLEAAKELMDTRGSTYVNRPRFVMAAELVGLSYITSFSQAGPGWKKQRTLLKHALSTQVIKRDYAAQFEKKGKQFIEALLDRPDNFLKEMKRVVAENVVELSYGRLKDEQGRDYIKLNAHLLDVVHRTIAGYVVDLVPARMKFKRDASQWNKDIEEMNRVTFERARESATSEASDAPSCFMVNNLQELYNKQHGSETAQELAEEEEAIRDSGFSLFIGGTDTISLSIQAFLLAMTVFPSVQEKARAEIDRVVGSEHPPSLDQFDDMPYLRAVMLETYRWCPLTAGGLPHLSVKDDVYNGYFIPKGTTVYSNAWGISRNTKHYANPSVFEPERYLGPQPELDPREFIFGYGRRICPGNELALRIIWTVAASVLWAFRLERLEGDTTPLEKDSDWFDVDTLWQKNLREKISLSVH
ncbi:hypothetical protein FRC00_013904 [Tulasnella sp. 408]|nr:hypothetical protein FRC00_013904 [Tulasnella sp. 408]